MAAPGSSTTSTDGSAREYEARTSRSNGDDPSALTTAAVDRAIASFREVMETRLRGIDTATELVASDLIQARAETDRAQQRLLVAFTKDIASAQELQGIRLGAMDKATELLAANLGRVPSDTDKQINALRDLLGARIDGMDVATKRLAEGAAKFPSDLDKAISSLREILVGEIGQALAETRRVGDVTQEKFAAIDGLFNSNDKALTAALAAQEKAAAEQQKSNTLAIDKSEKTTQETIRANDAKTASSIDAQGQTIADIKERVVRLESGGTAGAAAHDQERAVRDEQRADRGDARGGNAQVMQFVAVIFSALIIAIALYAALHK